MDRKTKDHPHRWEVSVTTAALSPFILEGQIRRYAWGSPTVIPQLLGQEATGAPAAELWFGAHADAPSQSRERHGNLAALIAANPEGLLGAGVVNRFGARLPFLLKVLAADAPLSLQVHPTNTQAEEGFGEENGRGIPLSASERSYRDRNHKPELLCALTDFEALCGFRRPSDTALLFDALAVSELAPCRSLLTEPDGVRSCVTVLLNLSEHAAGALVRAVESACRRVACSGGPWADVAQRGAQLASAYPGDVGVVVALLLNLLKLRPGQAVYLDAGQIHAYLRGAGVEIMASSDNVLRCGLTVKHVDTTEVLRIADFTATDVAPLEAVSDQDGWATFHTPAPDFRLSMVNLDHNLVKVRAREAQILLCTAGTARLVAPDLEIEMRRGEALFVAPGNSAMLSGTGTVFRAQAGLGA